MSHTDVLFRDLHADDLPDITEIESVCVNCFEDGETKLILTKIPFFRDVIISSFSCDHCGFKNTSVDSAGKIQNKGIKIIVTIKNVADLNRRIVQGKYSKLKIPHLDSEFPAGEGAFTTVEGSFQSIISNIEMLQEERKKVNDVLSSQLDEFIEKLKLLMECKEEFIIELCDPTGNSIIENPCAPKLDPQLTIVHYNRTLNENELLGITETNTNEENNEKTYVEESMEDFKPQQEIVMFNINCPNCNAPTETRMKMLDIPNFKEVIVMATTCESCGLKENEVKGGCGIADKGHRFILKIEDSLDLARDLLKSECAVIKIPEYELETQTGGALGGKFTTVEGLLRNVADQLLDTSPFFCGDSGSDNSTDSRMRELVNNIRQVADGKKLGEITLILHDPTGNSYIQDIYHPEQDPRLTVEYFERSHEENDDLGINDMITENYY